MPVSKAIVIEKFGNPSEVAQVVEQNVTDELQAGEVLVKMLFSPINPSDYLTLMGSYPAGVTEFPYIPGFEGVGEVVKSASGEYEQGDRVIINAQQWGKWRQFGVTKEQFLQKIPKQLPSEIASTLIVNPLSAFL